jgi:integrase
VPLSSAYFRSFWLTDGTQNITFFMTINVTPRPTRDGRKIFYTFEWGKEVGQRQATGIFTYARPKDQLQRNHNKEALAILETKKSELTLERQAIGSGHMPTHKFKANFLDYYEEFVKNNRRIGNRHLEGSLIHFRAFVKKGFLSPIDVTENLCTRFRQYLLDRFAGDTPANYYARFKRCIKSATKEGYFRISPAEDIAARSNPSRHVKENLEAEEYIKLLKAPCTNEEVKEAFVLCCYTGLRFVDVSRLEWTQVRGLELTTKIIQKKTGRPLVLTLHPIARRILEKRAVRATQYPPTAKVFDLPTADGSNKVLGAWMRRAGIDKHITWHCARLSFSVLLQDANVDNATVSLLLGQTSTKYVDKVYRRQRPLDQTETIKKLPDGTAYWL